jgi:hypothetical protein
MTDNFSKTQWPKYLPLPPDDIFALGVIALNYCQLENMFRALFSAVAQWNEFQTAALFHRLANNVRKDVLSELLGKTTLPDETKELVQYFLIGFGQCADNRHLLLHSSTGGAHRPGPGIPIGLVFERYSRAGNRLVCHPTLKELQTVADDIHRYTRFGACVAMEVSNYATHLAAGQPDRVHALPPALRKKPPPPIQLNWQIPADPKERGPRPVPLQMISAYRVRD